MATATIRPDTNRMYGLTHEIGGAAIVRVPKVIKVGIGLPKGKDLHVYIDSAGKWTISTSQGRKKFDTRKEAQTKYREMLPTATERKYPAKLEYFTFTTPDSEGGYVHDFDVIEAHGPLPTAIDVVFTEDQPFAAAYEMWTAAEKKCHGDGLNAMRVLAMAKTPEEKKLADDAKKAGEKYFPIVNGCKERGCPFATGDKPACKPHGRLRFTLVQLPRLGGVCQFDTTGYRSIANLSSCLSTLKGLSSPEAPERGYIAGVPLKLLVRPYRVKHQGKSSKAFAVHLEFRPETARRMRTQLLDAAREFHAPMVRQDDGTMLERPLLPAPDTEAIDAKALVNEFYVDSPSEEEIASEESDLIVDQGQQEFFPDEFGDGAPRFQEPQRKGKG